MLWISKSIAYSVDPIYLIITEKILHFRNSNESIEPFSFIFQKTVNSFNTSNVYTKETKVKARPR